MTKILIAIAALMVAAVATATPASADCIRLTDDPASPCREVQGIDKPVVNYTMAIDGDECVLNVEWTNPPVNANAYSLSHTEYGAHKETGSDFWNPFGQHAHAHTLRYSLKAAYSADSDAIVSTHGGYSTLSLPAPQHVAGAGEYWYAGFYHDEYWRGDSRRYGERVKFAFDGWTHDDFQAALFDCAQELEDKLEREAEAARVAAEQRAIAVEARERELELNRRLLIQVNDLKLAQERLASEVKLQEKETRITAEIVALQKRLIETRIATQEAILSGLERRAEIIRTGALERNEIMQEFLLQSGSRYEDIETKQAETAAVLRELRAGFAETQRRNEQALAAQEALLFEAEQQEAEISAELADKEAELESAAGGE